MAEDPARPDPALAPPDALQRGVNRRWAAEAWAQLADDAPAAAERLRADDELATSYAALVGASPAAGALLAREPALLDWLVPDPGGTPPIVTVEHIAARAMAAAEAADVADPTDPRVREALVRVHRGGLLAIAARDMLGAGETDEVADELSALAQGLIQAAQSIVTGDATDQGLVVIGMGKLGGEELNYVSDVDVLFVHADDADTRAAIRQAQQVMSLLGSHTSLGPVYEMDANLRPEGRNGPLSRSTASYRAYWDRWASTWEFQALLKARPLAGSPEVADRFTAAMGEHLWPEALGHEAVEEIQAMKARVETSKPVARDGDRQLKLAPGGLRDIEFAVQLLQLVHGPADETLRHRGTVPALRALAEGGYVDEGDAALFTDAYLFLRTVEHRLQLRGLRRTHTLPDDPDDLQDLARALGFRDLTVRSAAEELNRELVRVRGGVRRLHEQLFYRPLLATLASYDPDELGPVASAGLDVAAVEVRLRALAFAAPERARRDLEALVSGSGRTARQLRVVLPTMLEALAHTPDPDAGLAALRTLSEKLGGNPRFVRTIRDNPPAARLLARVLGTSPRLAEWLARQPEVLALLDDEDALAATTPEHDLHGVVQGLVRRGGGSVGRDALRRVKRREALRTQLRDVISHADADQVGRELTAIGEALLTAGLTSVGDPQVRIAVIGMGRFGARELAHASDLDVIVLHEGPTDVALEVVGQLVSFLSDVTPEKKAFRLDLGLRPEGRTGPMTRSRESMQAYYSRWAEPWELQALTQARFVAGDAELGQAFLDDVADLVYPTPVPEERLRAIRTMKARVEAERAGAGAAGRRSPRRGGGRIGSRVGGRAGMAASTAGDRRTASSPGGGGPGHLVREHSPDLKLGPGGLSDVEWTVQILQIAHGGADPSLRGPGTLHGLAVLEAAGVLPPEDAGWLRSGWLELSRVRNALYLLRERDTSTMPSSPDVRRRLARILGHADDQAMTESLDRTRRRVRKVFDRRFYE